MVAAPCAYWQRKAPVRRRTSRRTARPEDRKLAGRRTDRPWRPRARIRPADPQARVAARGPASAPKCRCRTHHGPGRHQPFARAQSRNRSPAPAADIDDPLARFDFGAVDQKIGDRRQQNVLGLLTVGPALAARSVPVSDLVGVLIVAYRVPSRFYFAAPSTLRRASQAEVFRRRLKTSRCAHCPQGSVGPGRGVAERSLVGPLGTLSASLRRRLFSLSVSPYLGTFFVWA